jgi:hypothetical protein
MRYNPKDTLPSTRSHLRSFHHLLTAHQIMNPSVD